MYPHVVIGGFVLLVQVVTIAPLYLLALGCLTLLCDPLLPLGNLLPDEVDAAPAPGRDGPARLGEACSVCLDRFLCGDAVVGRSALTCDHRTHAECMYHWRGHGRTACPLCRAPLAASHRYF